MLLLILFIISDVNPLIAMNCKCGEQNDAIGRRIYGGKKVLKNSYPWMVYIEFSKTVFCGGVVINDFYILTADHCIKRGLNFSIYVNTINRVHNNGIEFKPVNVVREMENEGVVLLKLHRRITFDSIIYPLCLPNPNSVYKNLNVTVAGWGLVETGGASKVLRETTLTVMSDHYCGSSGIGKHYHKDVMLCAYGENRDACRGDSGGPLFYNSGTRKYPKYELIGLVSLGVKCGTHIPGIYIKISRFMKWISQHTKDAKYCSY